MEEDQYPYQKEWENYRWLVKTEWILIAILIILFILFTLSNSSILVNVLLTIGVLLVTGMTIVNLNMTIWKCPRCRHSYFRWWNNQDTLFSKECRNCGLKKYEGSNIKRFFTDAS